MTAEKKINTSEVRFMMVGGTWIEAPQPIPAELDWISSKIWCTLCELGATVSGFEKIVDSFKTNGR